MEIGSISVVIAALGLLLAVPGALVSYRDWRRGHPTPPGTDSHAPEPSTRSSQPPFGDGADAPVTAELPTSTRRNGHITPIESPPRAVSIPRRLLSSLIDLYALLLIPIVIAAVVDASSSNAEAEDLSPAWTTALNTLFSVLVAAYIVIMGRTGRSPGKLIVAARLELANAPGMPPGIGRALLHVLIFLPLLWLSYLVALGRKDRRALHDLASGTQAVRTR